MIQTLKDYVIAGGDIELLDGKSVFIEGSNRQGEFHFCDRDNSLYIFDYSNGSICSCSVRDSDRESFVIYRKKRDGSIECVAGSVIRILSFEVADEPAKKKETVHRFGDKAKAQFYELFQIGVEVEGEWKLRARQIEEKCASYFSEDDDSLKGDGSISARNGGNEYELVSPVIKTLKEEKAFFTALDSLKVKGHFAYQNQSCGTHIHLDVKPEAITKISDTLGFNINGEADHSYMLKLLDSVDFERYFFKEYFRAFTLPKFWDRLRNDYCKPHSVVRNGTTRFTERPLDEVERIKEGRGRYHWLNFECLHRQAGIEFRIFPYITSTAGMEDVVKFCQYVVLSYWKSKATADRLQKITDYYNGVIAIDKSKLDKYDAMLFSSFRGEGRNITQVSYDLIEFTAYLAKKYEKKMKRAERENGGKKQNDSHVSLSDIPF